MKLNEFRVLEFMMIWEDEEFWDFEVNEGM